MTSPAKGKKFLPEPLDREDIEALLGSSICSQKSWTGTRNRAMIATMWRCGIRVSELTALELKDYTRYTRKTPARLRIMKPKGLQRGTPPRNVAVDEGLRIVIEAWLKFRGNKPGILFPSRHQVTHREGRQNRSNVAQILQRAAKAAGITKRCHPHGLRHTFAADLVSEKVSLLHIQRALGHTSIATTEKYLRGIGYEETVEALAGRVW